MKMNFVGLCHTTRSDTGNTQGSLSNEPKDFSENVDEEKEEERANEADDASLEEGVSAFVQTTSVEIPVPVKNEEAKDEAMRERH